MGTMNDIRRRFLGPRHRDVTYQTPTPARPKSRAQR